VTDKAAGFSATFKASVALETLGEAIAKWDIKVANNPEAEALFKALGRALDIATRLDPRRSGVIPSTKGTL